MSLTFRINFLYGVKKYGVFKCLKNEKQKTKKQQQQQKNKQTNNKNKNNNISTTMDTPTKRKNA